MRKEQHKYSKNEYLIHCNNGICIVEEIGILEIGDASRDYYTLKPFWDSTCKIYVPTDNDSSIVRRALTRKEAKDMLASIPLIEAAVIDDEKKSKDIYTVLLKTNNSRDWISMIKAIRLKHAQRESQGRTLSNIDERYLKKVSELLFGELAVSLDISVEQAQARVSERLIAQ